MKQAIIGVLVSILCFYSVGWADAIGPVGIAWTHPKQVLSYGQPISEVREALGQNIVQELEQPNSVLLGVYGILDLGETDIPVLVYVICMGDRLTGFADVMSLNDVSPQYYFHTFYNFTDLYQAYLGRAPDNRYTEWMETPTEALAANPLAALMAGALRFRVAWEETGKVPNEMATCALFAAQGKIFAILVEETTDPAILGHIPTGQSFSI